ncbi:MAG: tetratricopeptide repeat protein [Longimicrobiales bacterium]
MVGRLKLACSLMVAAAVIVPAASLDAQEGRYRILIPDFYPTNDANKGFGEKAAEELRELMSTLLTHEAIEEDEIKDNLKRFKMKMEELDCIKTRQLASQMNAQLALCADYTEQGDNRVLNATFHDVASGEEFTVDQGTFDKDAREEAAQHIFGSFDAYVQQVRAQGICQDYYQSQQYDNALRNCDEALALNPESIGTRYLRARILYELERYPEALEALERVLEVNEFHEDALQLAGYISASEGMDDQARDYYGRYLEINPGNAQVRMRIAYDLAQAGDPQGAMQFIQVGLDVEPDNVNLLEQYGGFAFAAALEVVQEAQMGPAQNDAGGIPPQAVTLYRQAIDAYTKVFAQKGAETPVGHLRNIMAAYIQLEEPAQAISMGERVLETHPQEDALWSMYADALQRNGQLNEAIAALDRVKEINPSHPSASLRQGNWLIQAGEIARAVQVLTGVAQANPEQAETAARMVFASAYQQGVSEKNWAHAIATITEAKKLPNVSQEMTHQLNFWHGYSLYQQGMEQQGPQTLQTAEATLPKFRQALQLFGNVGQYPSTVNVNLQQLLDATNTYIEIQDAIIKRGR